LEINGNGENEEDFFFEFFFLNCFKMGSFINGKKHPKILPLIIHLDLESIRKNDLVLISKILFFFFFLFPNGVVNLISFISPSLCAARHHR